MQDVTKCSSWPHGFAVMPSSAFDRRTLVQLLLHLHGPEACAGVLEFCT